MKTLKEILSILAEFKAGKSEEYGVEQLGVFGSYARGEQNESSDIDICVKLKHGGVFVFARLKDDLESMLNAKIDLVSLGSVMQPLFKKSLERDAIYI